MSFRFLSAAVVAVLVMSLPAPAQSPDQELLVNAEAKYSKAIEDGWSNAEAYNRRGSVRFMLGRVEDSIADFDRAVALEPESEPHHWQRGISYYYAGRFKEGREQFELHQTVNPHDVENGVWHFLCAARELGIDEARKRMLPISGDPRVPMAEIYELFRGAGSRKAVLRAAEGGDPSLRRTQLFYAHLYLALYYEASGDAGKVAEHIRLAAEEYSVGHYMWHVARVHASRLK